MQRFVVAFTALACTYLVIVWLHNTQTDGQKIAEGLLGEKWYSIHLGQDHVGFMYNLADKDAKGLWHFRTTTHFRLEQNQPNTIDKHLIFDAKHPHELVRAIYRNKEGSGKATRTLITDVSKSESGYTAQLIRNGRVSERAVDWSFSLEDFVGFEVWLNALSDGSSDGHIKLPQTATAKSPDFERLSIVSRNYDVIERNTEGFLVSTNAPWAATTTQLDSQFRPVSLSMAGIFNVKATNEAEAVALHQLHRKTSYLFPVDQRLDDHTNITTLNLNIVNPPKTIPGSLSLKSNPVTTRASAQNFIAEELRYPITDTDIQSLAVIVMNATEDQSAARSLVDQVNNRLTYTEEQPAGSVLKSLVTGRGECTDFADLFTTIARAAGFPARTVYGLAYRDGPQPAFMFHAWNELSVDGTWQAVDPTWNQTVVDATHIPLTDTQAAAMFLAASNSNVSFTVGDVQHRQP